MGLVPIEQALGWCVALYVVPYFYRDDRGILLMI